MTPEFFVIKNSNEWPKQKHKKTLDLFGFVTEGTRIFQLFAEAPEKNFFRNYQKQQKGSSLSPSLSAHIKFQMSRNDLSY